jgi:hypothetical protein
VISLQNGSGTAGKRRPRSSAPLGERTLRTRDLGGNADTNACGKAVAEMVE